MWSAKIYPLSLSFSLLESVEQMHSYPTAIPSFLANLVARLCPAVSLPFLKEEVSHFTIPDFSSQKGNRKTWTMDNFLFRFVLFRNKMFPA